MADWEEGQPIPLDGLRAAWIGLFVDKELGAHQWDQTLAAHDAEVAAKALEEYADQMASGYNASTLNAERRAIKREIRARAAALRRGGQ